MKQKLLQQVNEIYKLVEEKTDLNLFYTSPGRIKEWKELQDVINQKIVKCLANIIELLK